MSDLPISWKVVPLGTVVSLKTGPFGSALHKSDYVVGGTPVINPSHIKNGKIVPNQDITVSPEIACKLREYRLNEHEIVMGRRGEMGRCAIVSKMAHGWLCGTGSVVIRPESELNINYLQRFLTAPSTISSLIGDAVGSTMVNLNQGIILQLAIPIPPFEEQKRISAKLNAVLAQVDACRSRLENIPGIVKRFRQAVLDAAMSNSLTVSWRKINSQQPWQETVVEAVAQVGTGSTPLRANCAYFAPSGTPWVTSAATSQTLVIAANEFVTPAAIAAHRLKVYPVGTLLVAMYGEGKTRGQVTELGIPATINQACAAITVDAAKAIPTFVKLALQANYYAMRELAEGGNQPNLNLSKIKTFPLPLPSLMEQAEIVRRVETLFAFADRLEARVAAARAQVDNLTPSLLAKAFRGELVPQDPNDEPASELLKRIAAERTDGNGTKPKRKQ